MLLPRIALAATLLLALSGCGDEGPAPMSPPPPTKPPAEWDLSKLPKTDPPVRRFTTEGGVLVLVLREGEDAPKGTPKDIKFAGYKLDGTKFDSGIVTAANMRAGVMIAGWTEGLDDINLHEKRRILVPWASAFGALGKPPRIGRYQDIVFDVEWVRLEITDLVVGSGPEAKTGSKVTVHYVGTLEDGTVFDSSRERGQPATFDLKSGKDGVIEGWVKGLAGMRAGGIRRLWIPAHLAYGRQSKEEIPAWSDLTFVVELLQVD